MQRYIFLHGVDTALLRRKTFLNLVQTRKTCYMSWWICLQNRERFEKLLYLGAGRRL